MKYHVSIRVLHWLMAFIIIALLAMAETLEYWPKELKPSFYFWHKSLGIVIFFLVLIRISAKIITGTPAYPDKFSKMVIMMAKMGHLALYFLMIAIPLTGYVMSMAGGHGVNVFGLLELPDMVGKNEELGKAAYGLHETFGNILMAVIAVHVLAVVKHAVYDKENILKRMA